MFCSTIIPTIGRTSLHNAVQSVLEQELPAADFEVIVVNDSGRPLPDADWQHCEQVRILNTNRRERSVARNAGAAVAKGRYLHFLDDDDWLSPSALQHLWNLSQSSNAGWLYGSSQLVDGQGAPILQLHHRLNGNCFVQAMAGEWIPLQASLIESTLFFDVGGFNPQISGPEDIDLLRRISLRTDVAGVSEIVACIRWRTDGSTTDYDRHPQQSRWARERILDEDGCFQRLRASASDPFWRGRIVRLYLTSLLWNVQRRRLLTAASRASHAAVASLLAGQQALLPDFWRSVSHPYQSETFARGQAQAATVQSGIQ